MPGEDSAEEPNTVLSQEELDAILRRYVGVRTPDGNFLVQPPDAITVLQMPGLDPKVRDALIRQLDEWVELAKFAKSLSIGLAIGSGVMILFILSAMTWDDLFAGSGIWEFGLFLFVLAVFIASPLAIFVIGRPLKGVDAWSPTQSAETRDPVRRDN
jgi:hypothetical protein